MLPERASLCGLTPATIQERTGVRQPQSLPSPGRTRTISWLERLTTSAVQLGSSPLLTTGMAVRSSTAMTGLVGSFAGVGAIAARVRRTAGIIIGSYLLAGKTRRDGVSIGPDRISHRRCG